MIVIDGEWFHQQIKDKRKSVRGLARHLEIDPSAASRMLSGERKMKLEEANRIAIFLGAPVSDILKHAGIAMDADTIPTRIVLAVMIDETGAVIPLAEPKPLPQSVIEKATLAIGAGDHKQIIAGQIRAASGPLALWDDAVILFSHSDLVEPTAIGALSICRTRQGHQFLARLERARKTGEAQITTPAGKIEDAFLETATPVIAVIP
jgi:transcriptional regulator with XRE-family HTH domain